MPVACGESVLTGQNGSISFKPAGTSVCLKDYSDFPANSKAVITVPPDNGFVVGDVVQFEEEDGGNLDSGLSASTNYTVTARTNTTVTVELTSAIGTDVKLNGDGGEGAPNGGAVLTLTTTQLPTSGVTYTAVTGGATETNSANGSGATVNVTVDSGNVTVVAINAGGTGYLVGDTITIKGSTIGATDGTDDLTFPVATASPFVGGGDSPAPAHINMALSEFTSVCHVSSFEVSLDRDQIETTTLSCVCATGSTSNLAEFKTYQPGYVEATGSMEVQFTEDQQSMASRLIKSSLSKDQNGAEVRLYINAVCTNGSLDNSASQYLEAPISIMGFSFSVTPGEVTTATVNFSFTGQPSVVQL